MAESGAIPTGLDVTKAHVVAEWAHERPQITCRCDSQGRFVFVGSEEPTPHRFRISDGTKTPMPGAHASWVFAIELTPDGNTVFSGGGDGKLVWWEAAAENPVPLRVVEAHQGWIRALAVSPDGQWIASAGNDTVVRVWKVADGSLVKELPGHTRDVYSVRFHPSGAFLFSGDLLGQVRQWNVAEGKEVGLFDGKLLHSYNGAGQMVDFGGVRAITFSPDGASLIVGGLHKATNPLGAVHEPLVLTFNIEKRELVRQQVAEGITQGVIWRLQMLADGTLMGCSGGGTGGFLLFWKLDAEKNFHKFQFPNYARDMDLLPDGLRVASAQFDGKLRVAILSA